MGKKKDPNSPDFEVIYLFIYFFYHQFFYDKSLVVGSQEYGKIMFFTSIFISSM